MISRDEGLGVAGFRSREYVQDSAGPSLPWKLFTQLLIGPHSSCY